MKNSKIYIAKILKTSCNLRDSLNFKTVCIPDHLSLWWQAVGAVWCVPSKYTAKLASFGDFGKTVKTGLLCRQV